MRGPSLPLSPRPAQGRRHLPLADQARDVDRAMRPIHAIWEVTLKCDLACRHCGSRAGRARPDELTTAECLDLVRQLAELGVLEVSLIGGEAYLRPDWLEIVAAVRAAGMQCTMVTGGRGLTPERAQAAAAAGLQSVSVSIDGAPATHDRLRGLAGAHAGALEAARHLKAAGLPVAVNTQINRDSMAELPEVLETSIALGAHAWQFMLTVAMGRAADHPELLLQPEDLLELFPLLARLKTRGDQAGIRFLPGNNIGYFGPHEATLRAGFPQGHAGSCGAGCTTLGIEADGAIKGCPSLQRDPGPAAMSTTPGSATSGSAPPRCGSSATAPSTTSGGFAGPVTMPTNAGPAAPGPPSACSGGPATTHFATIASSSCNARGCAKGWSRSNRPPVSRSTMVGST